jgi:methenyltetrahydromethanopterin cyclohydrolase
VNVHAKTPVLSCLGSQYAGWSLSHKSEDVKFFALGSGPGRALAAREELFKEFGYQDKADSTVIVLEVDSMPPVEIADKVADNCGIKPENLTLILTPTTSLAGVMQIAIRVLEVAMHKAHTLHFPMDKIVDGFGTTPVAPPGGDFKCPAIHRLITAVRSVRFSNRTNMTFSKLIRCFSVRQKSLSPAPKPGKASLLVN